MAFRTDRTTGGIVQIVRRTLGGERLLHGGPNGGYRVGKSLGVAGAGCTGAAQDRKGDLCTISPPQGADIRLLGFRSRTSAENCARNTSLRSVLPGCRSLHLPFPVNYPPTRTPAPDPRAPPRQPPGIHEPSTTTPNESTRHPSLQADHFLSPPPALPSGPSARSSTSPSLSSSTTSPPSPGSSPSPVDPLDPHHPRCRSQIWCPVNPTAVTSSPLSVRT